MMQEVTSTFSNHLAMQLIATCAFGLEKLVYDEIKKIGLWVIKTEDGRVTFEGDDSAMIRANLWLRCSEQVQIKMAEFKAETFDELFDQIYALEWEKYIASSDAFPISATSTRSKLHSEPAIQSIIKKAIVKKLQSAHKTASLPENSGLMYQIIVKATKDQFTVGINTSGESLHKRGYRLKANLAPIKETLAAALVKLSDWTADRPLIDPFCGSGTILIEAVLLAQNIAPGLQRSFAFQKWPWIDQNLVTKICEEAKNAAKKLEKIQIYGFDIDPISLRIAEGNMSASEWKNFTSPINLKRADFRDLDFNKFENATFITNPPYGERLQNMNTATFSRQNRTNTNGSASTFSPKNNNILTPSTNPEITNLYRDFGKKFTHTQNCSLFLITSHENFPQLFGRPADKNRKLFNGNIRCYLFSFLAKAHHQLDKD